MTRLKAKQNEIKEAVEIIEKVEKVIKDDKPMIVIEEDDENKGNPFEDERPNSRISRKRSIETMDASTTTEDFRRRKIDFKEQLEKLKSVGRILTTRPKWAHIKPVEEMYIYKNTEEALDYIDDCSKFYFPFAFIFMMFVYWTSYLYIIEDKLEMDTF